MLFACSRPSSKTVDKLNSNAYAFHYKNLDSVCTYATKALNLSGSYSSGMAEAMNNIAFVNIAKMNFSLARKQLDSIYTFTDNQLELLIADVQNMRLCQRKSQNKDFYDYKVKAQQRIKRIKEEEGTLTERETKRFLYGETEYFYVLSTYYYYVGLDSLAQEALMSINYDGLLQKDTAQYLNYLYQCGTGYVIRANSQTATVQREYDKLLECYLMSKRMNYRFWEANSMQAISELLINGSNRDYLLNSNKVSFGYLNVDNMPDSLLAGYLAQKSVEEFRSYGDIYQISASMRTLARCFWCIGDYRSSLYYLNNAIDNKQVKQTPDLIASICELLSIVYSSLNDKHNSDINRNLYLDLQEKTRQDMELDARASQLEQTATVLNGMIAAILCIISLFVVILFRLKRIQSGNSNFVQELSDLKDKFFSLHIQKMNQLLEQNEDLDEKISMLSLSLDNNKRRNIDNRAKLFLLNSILPLIDRMVNETTKLEQRNETEELKSERLSYITELSEKINEYNNTITDWIQLRKGDIGMTIESFSLQDLFDIMKRSRVVFNIQGKELYVHDTKQVVKADKVLTLFMINTLTDNARKFTPKGGKIEIYATELEDSVEISIKDNGIGIEENKLGGLFNRNITDGHGFGLLNCRGILEKYRKYSKIFNVCRISAESSKNGSRFFFTLPKGIASAIVLFLCSITVWSQPLNNQEKLNVNAKADICLNRADAFADSTYFANVRADYKAALLYADSARIWLNKHYAHLRPKGKDFLHRIDGDNVIAPEIKWFRSGLNTDYNIILDIRNESAIAALALHEWALYKYNNSIYTKLFKDVSTDSSIAHYCRIMQRSETDKNIAIVLLVISCVFLSLATYLMYYRRVTKQNYLKELSRKLERILLSEEDTSAKAVEVEKLSVETALAKNESILNDIIDELHSESEKEVTLKNDILSKQEFIKKTSYENDRFYVSNNITENCLSTIKHETMYYPSRIYNYISSCENNPQGYDIGILKNLVSYYKDLYAILLEQANNQISDLNFERRQILIPVDSECENLYTIGDATLISYLFKLLKQVNAGEKPVYSASFDNTYLYIMAKSNLCAGKAEKQSLFTPQQDNIPFMIMRQIVRETNSAVNLCGGGISVSTDEKCNIVFTITLPNKLKQEK